MDFGGKIPVVIGVTGHRDILPEDVPRLKEAVAGKLRDMAAKYPHSPLLMLNSLAEGADQLCAEVALEEGWEIVAVLPLPQAEYEKDFQGEALERFRNLTQSAVACFVATSAEPEQDGRDYHYRQAGIYVAEHCHVLLALWDGVPPRKGGCGTAEIVDVKLRGVPYMEQEENLHPLDGYVIWIKANREQPDEKPEPAGEPKVEVLGGEDQLDQLLLETDTFNRDKNSLDASPESVYDVADRLSVRNSNLFSRITAGLSAAATFLAMAFLLYDEMTLYWMILVCGIMLVVLFVINRTAQRLQCHKKYMEYRILAEGLRVQAFLHRAGSESEVWEFLPWFWQVNAPWTKYALAVLAVDMQPVEHANALDYWILDQKGYHERALARTKAKAGHNERIMKFSLVVMVLSYVFAVVFEIVCGGLLTGRVLLTWGQLELIRTILKVLTGSLSAMTVFASDYYGKLSLEERLGDHARMIRLYEMVEERIADGCGMEVLLCKLAKEELGENANWFAYQGRNKPDISV